MEYERRINHYVFPLLKDKVQDALKYKKTPTKEIVDRVILSICNYHEVSVEQVQGNTRLLEPTNARHQACWVLKKAYEGGMSLNEIGKYLNNRHHSTIINSLQKVNNLCDVDKGYKMKLQHLLIVLKRDPLLNNLIKNITV